MRSPRPRDARQPVRRAVAIGAGVGVAVGAAAAAAGAVGGWPDWVPAATLLALLLGLVGSLSGGVIRVVVAHQLRSMWRLAGRDDPPPQELLVHTLVLIGMGAAGAAGGIVLVATRWVLAGEVVVL